MVTIILTLIIVGMLWCMYERSKTLEIDADVSEDARQKDMRK